MAPHGLALSLLHRAPTTPISLSPAYAVFRGCRALASRGQGAHLHDAEEPTTWAGLDEWRASPVDERRVWGGAPPQRGDPAAPAAAAAAPPPPAATLAECARVVLETADPAAKAAAAHAAFAAFARGDLPVGDSPGGGGPPARPARPARPRLVPAREVPTPKASPLPLAPHTLHGLAHVELNAVDLAADTVARFAPLRLPRAFYADFARVADDESRHLSWCLQRLAELGHAYGDLPAHDLLWQGAAASAADVRARLAVVPMSQEARGLDAGPRLAARLQGAGDARSARLVARIAAEERAHVAVGVFWFRALAGREAGAEAGDAALGAAYRAALAAAAPDLLRGPFDHAARAAVGLRREWYDPAAWPAGGGGGGGGAAGQQAAPGLAAALRERLAAVVAAEAGAAAA